MADKTSDSQQASALMPAIIDLDTGAAPDYVVDKDDSKPSKAARPSLSIDQYLSHNSKPVSSRERGVSADSKEMMQSKESRTSSSSKLSKTSEQAVEEQMELVEQNDFHVPRAGKALPDQDPFIGMLNHVKGLITPMKIGTGVVLAILCVIGIFVVPVEQFQFKVSVPNVNDFDGCLSICEKTGTDSEFANTLGGKGVCKTVKFKECTVSASYPKLKLKKCESPDPTKEKDSTKCQFLVQPETWKPYATMVIFIFAAQGCFERGPPEILLLGAGCIMCLLGIIRRTDLFAGMTNSGVLGLAVLGPISKAIGESGIMEKLVGVMLGSPKSLSVALFRMMIPVALFSAFLSNTATVAILIPIIVSWSRRLQVHPGQMLMPLSFAAQLGGSMTLLGSSHCLVAKGAIPSTVYDMQFFDLTPVGTMLALATAVAIWLVVKFTRLLKSSAEEADESVTTNLESDMYEWAFQVSGGGLVGKTLNDVGLDRLPGVARVTSPKGNEAVLQNGDELRAVSSERGIVQLRKVPGVKALNHEELAALGRQRHRRFLFEVGIRPGSEVFADGLPNAEDLREVFCAAFVAGPKRPYSALQESIESGEASKGGKQDIRDNCVILLEADERAAANMSAWTTEFPLVHKVHFSSPPRQGLPVDGYRAIAVFLGFLVLIVLVTAKVVKLDYGGGILCLFYLLIRALTPEDFLKSFSPKILGVIVGALAMGSALQRSGFVNFLANQMVTIAEPFGMAGFIVMIYIISWLMGLVINNSAIVAILGPMLISVVEKDPSLNIKGLIWGLTYAAGTCFTTPLGYQTNLMVMPDGKYTFGDFARFGITIQFIHFLLTVIFITIFTPVLT